MTRGHTDIPANGGQHLDIPHPASSPAAGGALNSSRRFCSRSQTPLLPLLSSRPQDQRDRSSSNGDGVVERAPELQRRGRAQPAGAVVPLRPAAVLRQRHHLRSRHHVCRVDARPAPPRPPRRLLPRGLRIRPPRPRHRAGELRAVQGVRGVPLPLGHARRARDLGAGGAGAWQLGEGAGVGGCARRPGHVPGQPGAVGHAAHHPGDRVRGHRLRRAPAHHGEGPREEEVPRRRLRPARLLQGPRQVRGVQAQGDQERPAGDVGVRGVLRAAVGVPGHGAAGEPGHPPRRPVAQQHRRHHHPQNDLPLSSAETTAAKNEDEARRGDGQTGCAGRVYWIDRWCFLCVDYWALPACVQQLYNDRRRRRLSGRPGTTCPCVM